MAVLWIAVRGVISLQMLSTDETKPAPTAKVVATGDSAFDPEQCEKVLCDAVPDYDAAGAAVHFIRNQVGDKICRHAGPRR